MPKLARSLWNELQGLSSQEIELIRRFESDARGTLFSAAADVLRKRGYVDEAIIIMEDGVNAYPQYHSARTILARDYYLKGLLEEAYHHVSIVVEKSADNLLAQRLKLKLDLIFNNKDAVTERLKLLKSIFPDDDFTKMIRELLANDDWHGSKTIVFNELARFGVLLDERDCNLSSDSALKKLVSASTTSTDSKQPTTWKIPNETLPNLHDQTPKMTEFANNDEPKHLGLGHFKRIQTDGFFNSDQNSRKVQNSSIDSTTLAEIYMSQGFSDKALSIYEKLYQSEPNNQDLKTKIIQIKSTHAVPFTSSPAILHHEAPKETTAKIKILEALLARLDKQQSAAQL